MYTIKNFIEIIRVKFQRISGKMKIFIDVQFAENVIGDLNSIKSLVWKTYLWKNQGRFKLNSALDITNKSALFPGNLGGIEYPLVERESGALEVF